MLHPLVILLIGLVTVIGMIIILRVNAFIALITSAMLVSLLSAGALGDKISRVAVAFGKTAGDIGIVIALAAVIGKCLMDSGAADRIVRSFLRLLGEKRASVALMSSGFVLAVPVFFDTVFYLLVPLARSLWRQTRKNYLLYVTAIGAGGAITHTLVPPTPGPLIMASTLKIDIGTMIMIGSMIGVPMAVVGLLACHAMNRMSDIPMRPTSGEPDPEPLPDEALPSLWISLAPVVLPVILISINTVTRALADAEHTELLRQGESLDWPATCGRLAGAPSKDATLADRFVAASLPEDVRGDLAAQAKDGSFTPELQARVKEATAALVDRKDLHEQPAFLALGLSDRADRLRKRGLENLSDEDHREFNWLVLEAAFPDQLQETPRREAAGITALVGNANLALLLSAAIAMATLLIQRGLTLGQLAKTTETALMSGGVIILITAGGGAFGKMLQEADVESAIRGVMGEDGSGTGFVLLVVAFAVAAVMKVAQGSSTVAMITTSAMMAPIIFAMDDPEFHAVYMACAIGCGSLVGSWMNDSGFWIFSRMSGLTEVEALKTWTILLVILGTSGLGFTLLAAWALPLV